MAYKPKTLTVPEGGTAAATLTGVLVGNGTGAITASTITQHGVIVAGASNALSTIAPGSSGNVLKSNGTDWTSGTISSTGFEILQVKSPSGTNPADGITYFLPVTGNLTDLTASGSAATRIYITSSGTITKCYGIFFVIGTTATTETSTVAIRLNNTTDTNVVTNLQLSAAVNAFNNTGLSISVSAGDFIEFKLICPTWVTNPTTVTYTISAVK